DLNLLVALDALLETRNVTRAAAKIGLSQSAMSHALKRLRDLTGDELLVRGKDRMLPTSRAEALATPVRRALEDIGKALAPPAAFDPKVARLRVTIGTTDYAELVLLPEVVRRLMREAPGIELRCVSVGEDQLTPLASRAIDLVISPLRPVVDERPGIFARRIFDERFVCVMRKGHPLAKQRLTLRRFTEAQHALVSPRGSEGGIVDDALARLGLARRVTVAVPHFLIAPHVVASSDLILTLAGRVANTLAEPLGLVVVPAPSELALAGFSMNLVWHERTHHDAPLKWVRDLFADVAKEI
ncbi:MAG: LysR family transcriptional regulator, partial [Polyangiales bacterium]